MKKLLNTLFVTTQGAYLSRDGENVVISVEREEKARFPVHLFEGIVCFGNVATSPFLLGLCADRGVGFSFLTENGHFLASVHGMVRGNVLLRREQFRRAEDEGHSLAIATHMIAAKIANARSVLLRALRDHGDKVEGAWGRVSSAEARLAQLSGRALQAESLNSLRGMEGESAELYFDVFDTLVTSQREHFRLNERSRRPPLDSMNALLSFLYTMLAHDIAAALESVGLDPFVGFLHRYRPGRRSLALDLMEEFRPHMADRLALSLINRRQVNHTGFKKSETGAVLMDDDTRKAVLVAWQERKREEVRHPFLEETVPIGLLPYCQALLLARHLRGDLDGYPAFLWK